MTTIRILYRGSLSSCNYDCSYCPFAKTTNTREELKQDAREIERFVNWVEGIDKKIGILFTPWGEAIVHRYYRQAMVRLSKMPHVERVAIQSNISGNLSDFSQADRDSIAIWATYHPTETTIDRFLGQCNELRDMNLKFSVGVVGMKQHFNEIRELRQQLPDSVYLWVNCYKREPNYYSSEDMEFLRAIDPYVDHNRVYYESFGKPCRAGELAFTVDENGDARRCHFIQEHLGNIYEDDIFSLLNPSNCTNATCGCHIGYVHRPELELYELYGDNVLERIPRDWNGALQQIPISV